MIANSAQPRAQLFLAPCWEQLAGLLVSVLTFPLSALAAE